MDDSLEFSQMGKIEGERGRRRRQAGGGRGGRWARMSVDPVQDGISVTMEGIRCHVKLW